MSHSHSVPATNRDGAVRISSDPPPTSPPHVAPARDDAVVGVTPHAATVAARPIPTPGEQQANSQPEIADLRASRQPTSDERSAGTLHTFAGGLGVSAPLFGGDEILIQRGELPASRGSGYVQHQHDFAAIALSPFQGVAGAIVSVADQEGPVDETGESENVLDLSGDLPNVNRTLLEDPELNPRVCAANSGRTSAAQPSFTAAGVENGSATPGVPGPGPDTGTKSMLEEVAFTGMDGATLFVCLKYVGVTGMSNCRKNVMAQALSQRLLQLRIPLADVRQHAHAYYKLKEKVSEARDVAEEPSASSEQKSEFVELQVV